MKTRIIHTRFWQDNFVTNLSYKEKLTFIYLLTNDRVGLTGMYELPDKYIKVDLDLTQGEVDSIKEKLSKAGKIYFWNGWVKILRHDKFNSYKGKKIEPALVRELAMIPNEIIEFNNTSIDTSIDGSSDTPNNHNTKTINNKLKIINNNINTINVKKYSKIEDITEQDMEEIAEYYKVPISFVKSKLEDMHLWVGEKTGRGKGRNWKLTLMNWVKRDGFVIKTRPQKGRVIDATNL